MVSRQFWTAFLLATTQTKSQKAAKQTRKDGTRFILHVRNYFIVNTSSAWSAGVHWLLLLLLYNQQQQQSNCREAGYFFFCVWDRLDQPLERYQLLFDHLIKISEKLQKLENFATLEYQSSLHIQTLKVSIASKSHTVWFKSWTKISTWPGVRLFHFVCFSTTKELKGHRFGFILQWKL